MEFTLRELQYMPACLRGERRKPKELHGLFLYSLEHQSEQSFNVVQSFVEYKVGFARFSRLKTTGKIKPVGFCDGHGINHSPIRAGSDEFIRLARDDPCKVEWHRNRRTSI
jgi:hypothetical protein